VQIGAFEDICRIQKASLSEAFCGKRRRRRKEENKNKLKYNSFTKSDMKSKNQYNLNISLSLIDFWAMSWRTGYIENVN
jgi:hypothetical protein